MVQLGALSKDEATRGRVDQGVVYTFSDKGLARHG
jgi:hypothetical protein